MQRRDASYDNSYVGSSQSGLKSGRVRKFRTLCQLCGSKRRGLDSCPDCDWDVSPVKLASDKVFRMAILCGLNRREAAELVAATLAAGVAAAQSPIAHAVVEEECRQMTRTMVLTVRARNAQRAA